VYENVEITKKAVQKDFLRSYSLVANPLLTSFLPDTQQIPQGLVIAPGKDARQICDCSHRPELDSIASNDMTSKETEHEVLFAQSFVKYLIWIWNLRISYPSEEIYLGDDDVSGAFRQAKWNPNVVGMSTFLIFGFLFLCTGLSFGNNTCPANWEVVALSRMMLARFLWSQASTIERVRQFLPTISTADPPTTLEVASFTPASPDSTHTGVFHADGSRRPPTFDHHVDDCLYAEVKAFLPQTIASSVLALYLILGFPDDTRGIRDCISWEKFTKTFSHRRKALGWIVDSRTLCVSMPPAKRDNLIDAIVKALRSSHLTMQELAILLGLLSHGTTVCRLMKCSYFNLQRLSKPASPASSLPISVTA